MQNTGNIRIKNIRPLISPALLLDQLPINIKAAKVITQARLDISNILKGKDKRLVVIIGPCSIHHPESAMEYATRLKKCIEQYQQELCIIMRVYFEKPRTTVGWKGLINDPYLDDTFCINEGLQGARQLLMQINNLGVPTGSEFLDTIIPQYISDLTSWSAIGARTTESQIHRELASGLSMPVGFKNGTGGSIKIAVDAVYAAKHPHHFLGVSKEGLAAIISTTSNEDCHLILRGSTHGTNYDQKTIDETVAMLQHCALPPRVMVDCSHGNSNKDFAQQPKVAAELAARIAAGNQTIFGLMIESNLIEGSQTLNDPKALTYGQSVTDACIGWQDTEEVLNLLSQAVKKSFESVK